MDKDVKETCKIVSSGIFSWTSTSLWFYTVITAKEQVSFFSNMNYFYWQNMLQGHKGKNWGDTQ